MSDRRPPLTKRVIRGLQEVRSLASADLEAGVVPERKDSDLAWRAIEWIDAVVSWSKITEPAQSQEESDHG